MRDFGGGLVRDHVDLWLPFDRGRAAALTSLAQLSEELVRRHEERVLLEDSADDDHGMGAHDLDHDVATRPGQIVAANRRLLAPVEAIFDERRLDEVLVSGGAVERAGMAPVVNGG